LIFTTVIKEENPDNPEGKEKYDTSGNMEEV